MKAITILISVLFISLYPATAYADTANDKAKIIDIINKSRAAYDKVSAFEMTVDYKLYSSATSSLITESYSGVIAKNKNNFYSKIHNTEFVKINSDFIKVDHQSKAIEYDKYTTAHEDSKFYNNAIKYLDYFTSYTLTTEGNFWKCTLSTPEISMIPYSKMVLYIDKNSYYITRQVLFMLVKNKYKNSKGNIAEDYPRLEILAKKKTENTVIDSKFRIESYLKRENNKIFPTSKLSNYQIIDLSKN